MVAFGTDGWRGRIAEDFTHANVQRVAHTLGAALAARDAARAIVGYDTRFGSAWFARTFADALAAHGLHVRLADRFTPTPVIGWAHQADDADATVMVTASHNPPSDNGLKIRLADRHSDAWAAVRAHLNSPAPAASNAHAAGGSVTLFDPTPGYDAFVRTQLDVDALARVPRVLAADAMHGAGIGAFARLLGGPGSQTALIPVRQDVNPSFGGHPPEPLARYLLPLVEAVRDGRAEVGLVLDGDADRLAAVDARGAYTDAHHLFTVLLHDLVVRRGQRGAVVKSLSTTVMLDRLARQHALPLITVPVGFDGVAEAMAAHDALMGGEESGGLAVRGHLLEGDGVFNGLLLLRAMTATVAPLHALVAEAQRLYGPVVYVRHDLPLARPVDKRTMAARLADAAPASISTERVVTVERMDGVKLTLSDDSWLLLRPSGTEPLLRVYAEAPTHAMVDQLVMLGQRLAAVAQA